MIPVVATFSISVQFTSTDDIAQLVYWLLRVIACSTVEITIEDTSETCTAIVSIRRGYGRQGDTYGYPSTRSKIKA